LQLSQSETFLSTMTADEAVITDNLAIFRPVVICLQRAQFNWDSTILAICPAMYWNQAHQDADNDEADGCDSIFHYGYLFY
jgi:hypothetical protein